MSLQVCNLASGSTGNATVVCAGEGSRRRTLLIDCGIGMRTVARRIAPHGLTFDHITDIVVTHFDQDHFRPWWVNRIRRNGIRVHVHRSHRGRALRAGLDGRNLCLVDGVREVAEDIELEPVMLPHDGDGSMGFVLEHADGRLGWVTDAGHMPKTLLDRFVALDLLGIESNYDPDLERESARPAALKRRVMGGRGHLSNAEALAATRAIDERSRLAHVMLLHLSRACNHPRIVQEEWERRAPHLVGRVTITTWDRASRMVEVASAAPRDRIPRNLFECGLGSEPPATVAALGVGRFEPVQRRT